jgi:hypothetical protein
VADFTRRTFLNDPPLGGMEGSRTPTGDQTVGRAYSLAWQEIGKAINEQNQKKSKHSEETIECLKSLREELKEAALSHQGARVNELPPEIQKQFLDIHKLIDQLIKDLPTKRDLEDWRRELKSFGGKFLTANTVSGTVAQLGAGAIGGAFGVGGETQFVVRAIQEGIGAIKDVKHGIGALASSTISGIDKTNTALNNLSKLLDPQSSTGFVNKFLSGLSKTIGGDLFKKTIATSFELAALYAVGEWLKRKGDKRESAVLDEYDRKHPGRRLTDIPGLTPEQKENITKGSPWSTHGRLGYDPNQQDFGPALGSNWWDPLFSMFGIKPPPGGGGAGSPLSPGPFGGGSIIPRGPDFKGVPKYARGGLIPLGGTGVVGEEGPELVQAQPGGGLVTSNSASGLGPLGTQARAFAEQRKRDLELLLALLDQDDSQWGGRPQLAAYHPSDDPTGEMGRGGAGFLGGGRGGGFPGGGPGGFPGGGPGGGPGRRGGGPGRRGGPDTGPASTGPDAPVSIPPQPQLTRPLPTGPDQTTTTTIIQTPWGPQPVPSDIPKHLQGLPAVLPWPEDTGGTVVGSGRDLGALSAAYESQGRPGDVTRDTGPGGKYAGYAYGAWQMLSPVGGGTGSQLSHFFAANPKYAQQFAGLTPKTEAFNQRWREVAARDPEGFKEAQRRQAQYELERPGGAIATAKGLGYNVNNRGVYEAIWSGAQQHGRINQILTEAAKDPNFSKMSAEDQIRAYYAARADYTDNPVSTKARLAGKHASPVPYAAGRGRYFEYGEMQKALEYAKQGDMRKNVPPSTTPIVPGSVPGMTVINTPWGPQPMGPGSRTVLGGPTESTTSVVATQPRPSGGEITIAFSGLHGKIDRESLLKIDPNAKVFDYGPQGQKDALEYLKANPGNVRVIGFSQGASDTTLGPFTKAAKEAGVNITSVDDIGRSNRSPAFKRNGMPGETISQHDPGMKILAGRQPQVSPQISSTQPPTGATELPEIRVSATGPKGGGTDSSTGPGVGPGVVTQSQSRVAGTRKGPITSTLNTQLNYAAAQAGVQVEVVSGGQPSSGPNRTGSHRHDLGGAADLYLSVGGRRLDPNRPEDYEKIKQFAYEAARAGATGIGFGRGYMGLGEIHVGGGTQAVWGAGGAGRNVDPGIAAAVQRGWRDRAKLGAPDLTKTPTQATQSAPSAPPGVIYPAPGTYSYPGAEGEVKPQPATQQSRTPKDLRTIHRPGFTIPQKSTEDVAAKHADAVKAIQSSKPETDSTVDHSPKKTIHRPGFTFPWAHTVAEARRKGREAVLGPDTEDTPIHENIPTPRPRPPDLGVKGGGDKASDMHREINRLKTQKNKNKRQHQEQKHRDSQESNTGEGDKGHHPVDTKKDHGHVSGNTGLMMAFVG